MFHLVDVREFRDHPPTPFPLVRFPALLFDSPRFRHLHSEFANEQTLKIAQEKVRRAYRANPYATFDVCQDALVSTKFPSANHLMPPFYSNSSMGSSAINIYRECRTRYLHGEFTWRYSGPNGCDRYRNLVISSCDMVPALFKN
jgi:hypothetical protein